jgi:hypothetical protein
MLKRAIRRVRRMFYAEVLDEIAGLRAEISALRFELKQEAAVGGGVASSPLARQIEAALLTIALNGANAETRETESRPQ